MSPDDFADRIRKAELRAERAKRRVEELERTRERHRRDSESRDQRPGPTGRAGGTRTTPAVSRLKRGLANTDPTKGDR